MVNCPLTEYTEVIDVVITAKLMSTLQGQQNIPCRFLCSGGKVVGHELACLLSLNCKSYLFGYTDFDTLSFCKMKDSNCGYHSYHLRSQTLQNFPCPTRHTTNLTKISSVKLGLGNFTFSAHTHETHTSHLSNDRSLEAVCCVSRSRLHS